MFVPKWMQSRDPGDPKTSTWVILSLKDSFSQRLLNMPAMRSFASRLITYHQHDSTTAWVRRARQASGGCSARGLSLSLAGSGQVHLRFYHRGMQWWGQHNALLLFATVRSTKAPAAQRISLVVTLTDRFLNCCQVLQWFFHLKTELKSKSPFQ